MAPATNPHDSEDGSQNPYNQEEEDSKSDSEAAASPPHPQPYFTPANSTTNTEHEYPQAYGAGQNPSPRNHFPLGYRDYEQVRGLEDLRRGAEERYFTRPLRQRQPRPLSINDSPRQDNHARIPPERDADLPVMSPSYRQAILKFPSLNGAVSPRGLRGQSAPPGPNPRVKTKAWPEEGTLYVAVEVPHHSITRRVDNNLINGTKLLNYTKITRGRRDGILKQERVRHVVRMGDQNLKGVWIPFERAYEIAKEYDIVDSLYPLFVFDLEKFLYCETNLTRTQQVVCDAQQVNEAFRAWMWSRPRGHTFTQPDLLGTSQEQQEPDSPPPAQNYPSSSTPSVPAPHNAPVPQRFAGPPGFDSQRYDRDAPPGFGPSSSSVRYSGRPVPRTHRRQYSIEKARRIQEQQNQTRNFDPENTFHLPPPPPPPPPPSERVWETAGPSSSSPSTTAHTPAGLGISTHVPVPDGSSSQLYPPGGGANPWMMHSAYQQHTYEQAPDLETQEEPQRQPNPPNPRHPPTPNRRRFAPGFPGPASSDFGFRDPNYYNR